MSSSLETHRSAEMGAQQETNTNKYDTSVKAKLFAGARSPGLSRLGDAACWWHPELGARATSPHRKWRAKSIEVPNKPLMPGGDLVTQHYWIIDICFSLTGQNSMHTFLSQHTQG